MKQSIKTFQELVEKLPDIVARFDRELRHLYVNPAVELATGIPPEDFIGKTNEEMGMPENMCSFWAERMKRVFITGQMDKFDFDFQTPDGVKTYQTIMVPEFSAGGSVETILTSARDVTEQRQTERLLQKTLDRLDVRIQEKTAKLEETNKNLSCEIEERIKVEEALYKSEKEYRDIFVNAIVGIFRSTPDGRYLRINPALARIHGFVSPEEMISLVTNIGEQLYVDPQDRKRYMGLLEKADTISNFEAQLYRKDKSKVWISMNVKAIRSPDGSIACYEGIVEDITSRRQAEIALSESEEKYRSLFDNSLDAVLLTSPDGSIFDANKAACEILGRPLDEIKRVGRNGLVDLADPRFYEALKERTLTGSTRSEFTMLRANGDKFPVECASIIFTDINGHQKTSMIIHDITKRKLTEESLHKTMNKLRKSLAGTIQVVSTTVETRDPYTAGHQRKVSNLARTIAQEMDLPDDTVENIRMSGIIHDIGKISVPAEILSKPGKLSEIEMSLIRVHPQSGYDILKDAELPYPLAEIVLQHHERLDGSGYPQGLKSNQILLEAKILAVADVVEAIATHRPYRPAKGIEAGLEEIDKNKGILYDENVVKVCLKLFREKGFVFESTE
ncbi:MAG: PAS domain S-box protein [Prolixibacteraceae bacterium]|nr:PAS domain S-box protein [Prolixibacteraceae bacterium]